MKKYVIVDLKGGLGNQLFILSFAKKLESLGYEVILDISFYSQKHDFPRNIEVDINSFFNKIISSKSDKIFKTFNRRIEEVESLSSIQFKQFTRFKGYYNNSLFIDKNFLINQLELPSKKISNSLMIHIRRGDYKYLNVELSEEYFVNAIKKIENFSNFQIDIFTDDFNFEIKNSKLNLFQINNIFYPVTKSPIETLKLMTSYENFIISNSTFSFFAAFLGQNEDTKTFYPKPWTKNSLLYEIKNIPHSWVAIENN